MTNPKRNDRCPCGSGKKYKKCCHFYSVDSSSNGTRTTSGGRFSLEREQDFIHNSDLLFTTCRTNDYSAACAQWWRCIESVLRRRLLQPLEELVDTNPDWLESDRRSAIVLPSEQEMEWESLFVRVLTDEYRRTKMTLGQMLMLVEKCMSDIRKGKRSKSVVRRNFVSYVSKHLVAFRWIKGEMDDVADMRSMFTPALLSSPLIQKFRNEASHDKSMDHATAVVGRLIAMRILDFMHYPLYCVTERLDELKHELANLRERRK